MQLLERGEQLGAQAGQHRLRLLDRHHCCLAFGSVVDSGIFDGVQCFFHPFRRLSDHGLERSNFVLGVHVSYGRDLCLEASRDSDHGVQPSWISPTIQDCNDPWLMSVISCMLRGGLGLRA